MAMGCLIRWYVPLDRFILEEEEEEEEE